MGPESEFPLYGAAIKNMFWNKLTADVPLAMGSKHKRAHDHDEIWGCGEKRKLRLPLHTAWRQKKEVSRSRGYTVVPAPKGKFVLDSTAGEQNSGRSGTSEPSANLLHPHGRMPSK